MSSYLVTSRKARCPRHCIVDEVVVARLMSWQASGDASHCERREAVRRLHAQAMTDAEIGDRTGMNQRSIFRIRNEELGLPAYNESVAS